MKQLDCCIDNTKPTAAYWTFSSQYCQKLRTYHANGWAETYTSTQQM